MSTIPQVNEHEVDEQWRSLEAFYERNGTLGPTCLAKGLIYFSELHGIDHASFEDYSDDEFVAMYMQVLLTRPDPDLEALGSLLVTLVGEESFTRESEPDLDRLVTRLHEIGGVAGLRALRGEAPHA